MCNLNACRDINIGKLFSQHCSKICNGLPQAKTLTVLCVTIVIILSRQMVQNGTLKLTSKKKNLFSQWMSLNSPFYN